MAATTHAAVGREPRRGPIAETFAAVVVTGVAAHAAFALAAVTFLGGLLAQLL